LVAPELPCHALPLPLLLGRYPALTRVSEQRQRGEQRRLRRGGGEAREGAAGGRHEWKEEAHTLTPCFDDLQLRQRTSLSAARTRSLASRRIRSAPPHGPLCPVPA